MKWKMKMTKTTRVVEAYRNAAMQLYGITREQAERSIVHPEDDKGRWAWSQARGALVILYLERAALRPLDYFGPYHLDECIKLEDEAGVGHIETINPAVAAVYE